VAAKSIFGFPRLKTPEPSNIRIDWQSLFLTEWTKQRSKLSLWQPIYSGRREKGWSSRFQKNHKKPRECFSPKSESASLPKERSHSPAELQQLDLSAEQMLRNFPRLQGRLDLRIVFYQRRNFYKSFKAKQLKKPQLPESFGDTRENWGPRQPDNPSVGSQLKAWLYTVLNKIVISLFVQLPLKVVSQR